MLPYFRLACRRQAEQIQMEDFFSKRKQNGGLPTLSIFPPLQGFIQEVWEKTLAKLGKKHIDKTSKFLKIYQQHFKIG